MGAWDWRGGALGGLIDTFLLNFTQLKFGGQATARSAHRAFTSGFEPFEGLWSSTRLGYPGWSLSTRLSAASLTSFKATVTTPCGLLLGMA